MLLNRHYRELRDILQLPLAYLYIKVKIKTVVM